MGYLDRFTKGPYKGKTQFQKFWHFIWHEDSIESWLANILLAFITIKFIIYPLLGLILGTGYPIVAVVSGSMHHAGSFDEWWEGAGQWYIDAGLEKEQFRDFPFSDGFDKGDIMLLRGTTAKEVRVGDILVFRSARPDPIIHRVVHKNNFDGEYSIQTKGDNYLTNPGSIQSPFLDELDIREEQVIGKAFIRVPYLGYVKIWAVDFLCLFNRFPFCIT